MLRSSYLSLLWSASDRPHGLVFLLLLWRCCLFGCCCVPMLQGSFTLPCLCMVPFCLSCLRFLQTGSGLVCVHLHACIRLCCSSLSVLVVVPCVFVLDFPPVRAPRAPCTKTRPCAHSNTYTTLHQRGRTRKLRIPLLS